MSPNHSAGVHGEHWLLPELPLLEGDHYPHQRLILRHFLKDSYHKIKHSKVKQVIVEIDTLIIMIVVVISQNVWIPYIYKISSGLGTIESAD